MWVIASTTDGIHIVPLHLTKPHHPPDWPVVLGVVGFFCGLFLALLAMSVIDAGVATVYVLISEDPEAFMRTNPALFVELNNAWAAIGYNYQSKQYMRP